MKKCRECNLEKEEQLFGQYKNRNKIYYRNICKVCRSKEESIKYKNNLVVSERMKATSRKTALRNLYGITETNFDEMYINQNGCCAICKKQTKKKLNIDHCHKTKKVRGLLCWNCNMGIGYFKDDINLLNNAIKYLKQ